MAADINKGRVRGKRSGLRQDELSITSSTEPGARR